MGNLVKLKTLSMASLALLTVFLVSSETKADPFMLSNGQSVTVVYQTSFTGSHAVATFTYNQTNQTLTVVLTNNSVGDDTKLFAFGFNAGGVTQVGNAAISYAAGTAADFEQGSQELQLGFGVNPDGGNNNDVLNNGENLTAVFTFTTGPNLLTIDLTKIHMGSLGSSDQSEKPVGVPTPTTTVPEPASLLLLGSGLMAIGTRVRRRRRTEK